jgi:hypothetical protein
MLLIAIHLKNYFMDMQYQKVIFQHHGEIYFKQLVMYFIHIDALWSFQYTMHCEFDLLLLQKITGKLFKTNTEEFHLFVQKRVGKFNLLQVLAKTF